MQVPRPARPLSTSHRAEALSPVPFTLRLAQGERKNQSTHQAERKATLEASERNRTLEASGQAYPNKPIRIVTAEIGGSQDVAARIMSQGLSGPLGQPVIVDNRASGVIPGEIVAKVKSEMARMGKVIRDARIRAQ